MILLVVSASTWQNQSVETSPGDDKYQPASAEDEAFCLADTLTGMSDEEIARMAKQEAESEVSSCALSGIPLDQAPLEEGLTMVYLRVRAEQAAKQKAASASPGTSPLPDTPIVIELGNLPPNCDVPMLIEEIEDSYRHLWGSYLALARHFEASGDAGQAAIYNEKFDHFCRLEMDLYLLSPHAWWTHKTELLPPLIKEMRAERMQFLGY